MQQRLQQLDRKWALVCFGGVAIFVFGLTFFPHGLVGPRDWERSSRLMHARPQCGHQNEMLARFTKEAQAAEKVQDLVVIRILLVP